MKFSTQHVLKWMPRQQLISLGVDHEGYQEVLLVFNQGEDIEGVTWFPAQPISEEFVKRIEARQGQLGGRKVNLYLPGWLKETVSPYLARLKAASVNVSYTSFFHLKAEGGRLSLRSTLRVLCIDDSATILKMIAQCLTDEDGYKVVEQCLDPHKALQRVQELKPDVITLDMQMPGRTGVDVTKELMAKSPVPILILSALSLEEGNLVFEALHSGAFDYLQKPQFDQLPAFRQELQQKLLTARRGFGTQQKIQKSKPKTLRPVVASTGKVEYASHLLWCIGSSTGGTQALTQVLTSLPSQIPPTLIVQHIPPVFSKSFADSMNALCPFEVREAVHGDIVKENTVYIAPGGMQMSLKGGAGAMTIAIEDAPPVNRFKPSVDYLFESIAKVRDLKIVAGILTGMGKDGANGLLHLRKIGARTYSQDEATSVVFGMPRAALENGASELALPLEKIAEHLLHISETGFRGKDKAS